MKPMELSNESVVSPGKEFIRDIRKRLSEPPPTAAHVSDTLTMLSNFTYDVATSFQMAIELGQIKGEMSFGWRTKWEDILEDVSAKMDNMINEEPDVWKTHAWTKLGLLREDLPDESSIDKVIR